MTIPAGQFKATCLQLMEQVKRSRQPITITKRGKAVAKLVPADEPEHRPLFGMLQGSIAIHGDIVAPTGEKWDAET
jgi:prevent-host-death family protein